MGAEGKAEAKSPKMTPIFADDKGNMYKPNPKYTEKMQGLKQKPFGMMAYGMHKMNPSKNKFGTDNIPSDDERFIKISSPQVSAEENKQAYTKAKRYTKGGLF